MPTKKIRDLPSACSHPEHNPPSMRVFKPGVYEHTCPSCKRKVVFTVSRPVCGGGALGYRRSVDLWRARGHA